MDNTTNKIPLRDLHRKGIELGQKQKDATKSTDGKTPPSEPSKMLTLTKKDKADYGGQYHLPEKVDWLSFQKWRQYNSPILKEKRYHNCNSKDKDKPYVT